MIARIERAQLIRGLRGPPHPVEDVIDHAVQPELPPILRRVDLLHALTLERLDLMRSNRSPATDNDANVLAAALPQHVHHVGEVLVVATLVRADRHRVGILLYRGGDDVRYAAVVPQVHDLGPVRLQQPADHVDGGIVPIEERGRGDEAERPNRAFRRRLRQGVATPGAGIHA